MFKPNYQITPKLLANIKKISTLAVQLEHRRFPQPVLAELRRLSREVSAFASTSIEGNPLPLTEVKSLIKHQPKNLRDSEREVINYNQALLVWEKQSRQIGFKFDSKTILNIHSLIMSRLLPPGKLNKWRREPVLVNNPKTSQPVYLPPEHEEVSGLMKELLAYIQSNLNNIDPLILAGIFHKQFVIIHPFVDGNGRTARLATKVLLVAAGFDTFNLFSFENYYNNNVSNYFNRVGCQGNYYEIKNKIDFTSWLEYFTDGIIDELWRVKKDLEKLFQSPANRLSVHLQKLLDHLVKNSYLTDAEYAKITKRAKPTRNLDFNKLIALGLIERKGKGKNTYYQIK